MIGGIGRGLASVPSRADPPLVFNARGLGPPSMDKLILLMSEHSVNVRIVHPASAEESS